MINIIKDKLNYIKMYIKAACYVLFFDAYPNRPWKQRIELIAVYSRMYYNFIFRSSENK